jgi:hypothetical protein
MDTPDKSKKKQNLAALGALMLFGGIMVLRRASDTEVFYHRISEEGSTSWATGLAWMLILGGGGLLLFSLAEYFRNKG